MTRSPARALSVVGVATAILIGATTCSSDGPAHSAAPPVSAVTTTVDPPAVPAESAESGATFVADRLDEIDTASLAVVDYVGRNWGIAELTAARAVAQARLSGAGAPSTPDAPSGPSVDERLLRRLIDPSAPPPTPSAATEDRTSDALAVALHCDQARPGNAYAAELGDLAAGGGYGTTHVALALGWLRERGCTLEGTETLEASVVDTMAAELSDAPVVTDLALEQSACLLYLSHADRVPEGWAARVVAAQHPDGGWGHKGPDSESSWHATILATWTLLGLTEPGRSAPMSRVG